MALGLIVLALAHLDSISVPHFDCVDPKESTHGECRESIRRSSRVLIHVQGDS